MTFRTTSAIGFVVGFALFGSVTFVPLYLQIVKGHSADRVRAADDADDARPARHLDASGFLISRYGRYRAFPISARRSRPSGCTCSQPLEVATPT